MEMLGEIEDLYVQSDADYCDDLVDIEANLID